MNEPWFDPNRWGRLLGILMGWIGGMWGGLAGILALFAPEITLPVVLSVGVVLWLLSLVLLVAGLIALWARQPYDVWWRCLGFPGLVSILVCSIILLYFPQQFRDWQERHMFGKPRQERRLNELWFDPYSGRVQGLQGVFMGLWGAWMGAGNSLAHQGKARYLVLGFGVLLWGLSLVLLAAGLTALCVGQPFGVWFQLGTPGLTGIFVYAHLLLQFRKIYQRVVEERRMQAEDLC